MYFRGVLGWPYYILFSEVVPASSIFSLHGGNVPLVIPLTYLFWMGGRLIFFIWWLGMKKGCGGAGSCAIDVVVNDGPGSCVWQLMNQGSFGSRSGGRSVVFSALVFICVLAFSQTVTSSLFPESVWAQGSSNSGGLSLIFTSSHFTSSHLHIFSSSHLLIFTSSHLHIFSLHIFSSSHLLIFTSSHLHIFSSQHLLIFTSAHLHICTSSHLLIFTSSHLHSCSSWHLLIFTSSHLHIFSSSHLLIFTSAHLHIFSSSHLHIFIISSHPHIFTSSPVALLPSCSLLLFYFSSEGGGRGSANETARNATLSHETKFDRPKLR